MSEVKYMATDKKEVQPVPAKGSLKKEKEKAKPSGKKRKFDLKKTAVAIGHFFRDVYFELKKVTWPTKKEFVSYSIAVLVFVLIFGLIIFSMDTILSLGVEYLVS